jgi:GNAT superfamily N-acetyltransferase
MKAMKRHDVEIRPYVGEDEPHVLELLRITLDRGPIGSRSPEFFHWKHFASPFGPSFMLVAETQGEIVGLRAFMRWRFHSDGEVMDAVRAVDTATDPAFQGMGIFSQLTREALEVLPGQAAFVFNTPNEKSLPGYLKMGWQMVGQVPISVRIRRPFRFIRRIGSIKSGGERGTVELPAEADRAEDVLREGGPVSSLLNETAAPDARISTVRDLQFLRWRYAHAPHLGYRAVCEWEGVRLKGLAIFRVRSRGRLLESTLADVIVAPGDGLTARRLMRQVLRSAPVDHVASHFTKGTGMAAASSGFHRAPGGLTLVVNPLRTGLRKDPTILDSWALSMGDLEVF